VESHRSTISETSICEPGDTDTTGKETVDKKRKKLKVTKIVTGYADDVALITEWPSQNQKAINAMQRWLKWTETMAAKPQKCVATALEEGRGKDPVLEIAGATMKWIANEAFKFLGKQTCTNCSDEAARKKLLLKFEKFVDKIDETPLTGSQKMWIFDKVLMSKISWDFLIHDMTVTFVRKLAAIQTKMFKKWGHYSKSGNVTVFYRSKKNFGWNMKEMVTFFKKKPIGKMPSSEILQRSRCEAIV